VEDNGGGRPRRWSGSDGCRSWPWQWRASQATAAAIPSRIWRPQAPARRPDRAYSGRFVGCSGKLCHLCTRCSTSQSAFGQPPPRHVSGSRSYTGQLICRRSSRSESITMSSSCWNRSKSCSGLDELISLPAESDPLRPHKDGPCSPTSTHSDTRRGRSVISSNVIA
jgi:hypothetical protein